LLLGQGVREATPKGSCRALMARYARMSTIVSQKSRKLLFSHSPVHLYGNWGLARSQSLYTYHPGFYPAVPAVPVGSMRRGSIAIQLLHTETSGLKQNGNKSILIVFINFHYENPSRTTTTPSSQDISQGISQKLKPPHDHIPVPESLPHQSLS